uniref:Tetrapyrrole methylase domain-containing protein n=2 Tax=Rhodosorus marinus TaxID=101924 RepID=A0A7S3A613_9RHOD|mmetsp:Transcript_4751/g.20382  ORF Transcript_4751/g.20382 Transcript_4751/m.20382 type:complete len:380 (+) Transcript_4751:100-1239(+)
MRRLVGFVAGALLPGRNRNLGAQLCRRSVSNALKLVDDVLKGEQHFLAERSFNKEPGAVYVVATPIGNMEDFTLRGLRVLRGVDAICMEDTVHSGIMLKRIYGDRDPSQTFIHFAHANWARATPQILRRVAKGEAIAVIADAGTPCISDPGWQIIDICLEKGVKVIPIPGVTAATAALSVSGCSSQMYSFFGLISNQKKKLKKRSFKLIQQCDEAIVLYESKHRLVKTLEILSKMKGFENRPVTVGKEITKMHEQIQRFENCKEAGLHYAERKPKGEYTLVISPKEKVQEIQIGELDMYERQEEFKEDYDAEYMNALDICKALVEDGCPAQTACRVLARFSKLNRRQLYNATILSNQKTRLPEEEEGVVGNVIDVDSID